MAGVNPLLVLTVATLGLLLAVTAGILVSRDWESYRPTLTPSDAEGPISNFLKSPVAWTLGFLAGTLGLAATAMLWVAGPESMQGTVALGVLAVLGVIFGFFVFAGTWDAIRTRGRSNSEAVGIGAIVLGLLFVLVITVQLVTGG